MNQRIEEEHLLEIEKLSFPRKDRILGFLLILSDFVVGEESVQTIG